MPSVCLYFHVHQPIRVKKFGVLDIGRSEDYFDDRHNKTILDKVASKCYEPTNRLLLDLIKRHDGKFKISYSITGTFIDQAKAWRPDLIKSFQNLAKTGCVEFLGETYYHSLTSLYSEQEFYDQVTKHMDTIEELFGQRPTVFRNTELVYFDHLANLISELGFKAVLAEGWDKVLHWRSPNFVYETNDQPIKLLLKNYKLSDDVAFRFSNKGWEEWPLTAEKFAQWVHAVNGSGEVINLFMDYETFGEHQWEDTGIFNFMDKVPDEILKHPDMDFITVGEEADRYPAVGKLSMPYPVSWADTERDLSAWLGNDMQSGTIRALYDLEEKVKKIGDKKMIEDWRRLQTSDNFYYMCTKWFSDGDVHKYFNAYDRPHDAYIYFTNILVDFVHRVEEKLAEMEENFAHEVEQQKDGLEKVLHGLMKPEKVGVE
ncbi:MAG: Glycosyl hydrolase, family 57 [candidate division CPR2 bacterium GW2011_GWC1_41_48]|uniref:Glycosyl hydrolase, family 57 n=1 Tax=candidate division CPR2 bacterium GW2011_GWC1_41_48 TaxID=1618344 RepID=A0A0G0YIY9_UNCC2|nr:MAG: Glycosyl hydrolase, family 57 [candidate division CPR2 bacterium GW2011_GWC2_39_35]KKR27936.1 MAG: Glycosyl hydrolase, family 57 [candidate division CPR2 bacterium GW2011_GWD1_39_7]KKR29020.1 MAG: Glycosyl hydrolase, family 57 [candidate division CPR2 bacterium GW2011_GWD2_39_7]KKS09516.1 MAG: Glycosyl hydrolase, family 57 [candidate division CPR2 bacterium GW2011_GWC1_41_48]OGB60142.1 MAG: alpha-amylase [candidate division CPR2 bacterium GWD1_39_7]OGB70418.1 MAG: alpha-amylase [candid